MCELLETQELLLRMQMLNPDVKEQIAERHTKTLKLSEALAAAITSKTSTN